MTKNETLTVFDGFISALAYLRYDEPPRGCRGTLDDKLDAIPAWSSAQNIRLASEAVWNLLSQTENPAITGFLTKSYEQANDICYDGMMTIYMAEDNIVPETLKSTFSFFVLSYVISRLSSTKGTNKRDIIDGMRPWQALMKRDESEWALFKDLVKALGFTEDIGATTQPDHEQQNHNLSGRGHLPEGTTCSNPWQMTSIYWSIRQYIYRHRGFWFTLGDGCSPVERGDKCISRWMESLFTDPILDSSVENLQCVYHNKDLTYHGIVIIILRLHRIGYLQSVDDLQSYMTGIADLFFEDSA